MICGGVGRIAFGLNADQVGNLRTYRVAAFCQAACLILFPSLTETQSLMALSAVFGFALSGNMTCMLLHIRDEAPVGRYGAAIASVLFLAWAGLGVGGYAGGALFDATGRYGGSFYTAAVFGIIAFVLLTALEYGPGILRSNHSLPDVL